MASIKGSCLCGNVRYSADAEPAFVGVCHCADCQRFTGSAFSTVIAVPAAALRVTGVLKTFSKQGDSGKLIHRRFCPECGSGIVDEAQALPGMVMLNAGTLDDRSWVKPQSEIYCDSAQPWVRLGGELKRFAKLPA
ncbi:MAG TPA: GFA family protein [Steroidobacteraceae bacterium]|nr:GFA family protein [Steroidobacteraceae bacterium]